MDEYILSMFKLSGKIALVSGAGSGIGKEIALKLAEAGSFVYVTDVNLETAGKTSEEILGAGGEACALQLDIADLAQCEVVSRKVTAEKGRLDILVNNAGVGCVGNIEETDPQDLQRLLNVNVTGLFNLTRQFIPGMVQRKSGSIINLSSIGGLVGVPDRFAYCTTKFAVTGMTKSLALDYAKSQIRVNCICPGRVETPWVAQRLKEYEDPEAARKQMTETQPIGRMGRPEEIAWAAVYLASDEAAFVTGAEFNIDGGWNAG